MLQGLLVQEGFKVGRLHVATLMKRMGRAGKRHGFGRTREGSALPQAEHRETGPGAQNIPLSGSRKRPIIRPNQVWAMDITSIPMARGFICLAAVLDWFTEAVSWHGGCRSRWRPTSAWKRSKRRWRVTARPRYSTPTKAARAVSTDFLKVLAAREIKISMDGKGAWRDNVFVERLWRTIKYEEVYLRAYASVPEARAGIGRYLASCNSRRPHSSLDGKTPDQAYFNQPMPETVAA